MHGLQAIEVPWFLDLKLNSYILAFERFDPLFNIVQCTWGNLISN